MPPKAEEKKAIVVERDNETQIFIGNLQIRLQDQPQGHGPLQGESGITIWREPFVKHTEETFETGVSELIKRTHFTENSVKEMRDLATND